MFAQGFDIGRIPWGPGTFGSLLGILWFAVLLTPGSLLLYLVGTVVGILFSVVICGEGERILGESDPGSIVLDEIIALPICYLPWVLHEWHRAGAMPGAEVFFSGRGWLGTAGIWFPGFTQ